ncbi:sensor histidine kinase [Mucilaginibacter terrigena]|nr:histidine kinase [Mucilaginibacter terrigena]
MKRKVILQHAVAWAIFMFYEVTSIYLVRGMAGALSDYVAHYILNILLFYINARIITGSGSVRKKIGLIASLVLGYMAVNFVMNTMLEYFAVQILRPSRPIGYFFVASFWRCFYFLGLSTVYAFSVNLIRSTKKINAMLTEQMQKEKDQILLQNELLSAKNGLLRAQINPHLFFNTLNFIYNSVYKLSATAGDAVMLLADITRFSIANTDTDGKVYLEDELVNIDDLITLNQIRFDSKLQVHFVKEGDFKDLRIIPLVLLTLVENVFKYGDLQDKDQPALIQIKQMDGFVHFATRNKKVFDSKEISGSGIGINNSKKRLHQAYRDSFKLRVNETDDLFYVDLTINTDCLCFVAI